MANEKIRIDADLRAFKRLERKAQQISRPLRKVMNAAANIIRKDTQKRIKASLGKSRIAKEVRYKTDAKTLRTIVYVRRVAIFFNHGTGRRSTKAGKNRGTFPYKFGWLADSVAANEDEIKEIIFDKEILF
jgi:hypothetical protein